MKIFNLKSVSIFLFFLFIFCTRVLAQSQSSDAIAVRVLPNPHHYSAARWYQEQGFSGSPQSLTVDGYEAVRDGRSVYVNAGNVVGSVLYTNIYLLSFNQEAEDATVDIVSRILSRWKFNTNYNAPGTCNLTTTKTCLYSDECPDGEYCLSPKAKMIRDTRRLSDLAEIKLLLESYYQVRGNYPILSSGSYIVNHSVSTWPSWQKLFAQHLGQELPIDPINQLGDCGEARFDKVTCWDNGAQQFADGNPANAIFDLPLGSYAYVYTVSADGLKYNLYGDLEEGYGAASADGDIVGGGAELETAGNSPVFTGETLSGKSGEKFQGYIGIYDSNPSAKLTVTINTSGTTWTAWSAAPQIDTVPSVPNQRKIFAASAGVAGNYSFTATIDNGLGLPTSITTKTFTISIVNDPPVISASDITYIASTTNPLDLRFAVRDAVSNFPLNYSITPNGAFGLNPATFALDPSGEFYILSVGGYFNPLTQSPIDTTKDYNFVTTATDVFGGMSTDTFTVTVRNNKPIFNLPLPCDTNVRVGNSYNTCTLKAEDPDGNAISFYSFSAPPSGMIFSTSGIISGTPPASVQGAHNISITATDEFGAVSTSASFTLNINTYCGDGVKQGVGEAAVQNMERIGGPADNGVEDCDGASGLAASPGDSSLDKMYACSGTPCPAGPSCPGACVFVAGGNGGYCGDSIAQNGNSGTTNFGEECDDGMNAGAVSGADRCDTRNVNGYGFCRNTFCGDGVVQSPNGRALLGLGGTGNEQCDDSQNSINTDKCYNNCTFTYCGDGIIQAPNGYDVSEACDDAAANSPTGECTSSCSLTYCGDGVIQPQNGVFMQGISGTGDEECETDADCSPGFECNGCRCDCIPCRFGETNFDYCCFN